MDKIIMTPHNLEILHEKLNSINNKLDQIGGKNEILTDLNKNIKELKTTKTTIISLLKKLGLNNLGHTVDFELENTLNNIINNVSSIVPNTSNIMKGGCGCSKELRKQLGGCGCNDSNKQLGGVIKCSFIKNSKKYNNCQIIDISNSKEFIIKDSKQKLHKISSNNIEVDMQNISNINTQISKINKGIINNSNKNYMLGGHDEGSVNTVDSANNLMENTTSSIPDGLCE